MKSALDNLIEELEAGAWQAPKAPRPVQVGEAWPHASRDVEWRFGQPHARLFPFLGRKVRTPGGSGTLIQVFADRVTVVLDSELSRCAFFQPAEIEPVSWELGDA
jgi:hypothetical protein